MRYVIDVRYWHKADIGLCTAYVRFRGKADTGGRGGDLKKRLNEATATPPCQNSPNIEENIAMSAMGQKQTCAAHKPMSALCQ